jgi:hypothetical protein
MAKAEKLHESIKMLGQIGGTPFTIMGLTKNFSSMPHINKGDSKLSYILWFFQNKL